VPRSGQLVRLDFNDKWEELHRESMFHELQNRIRDVPQGLLYVLTEEQGGALLKMEPWTAPAAARRCKTARFKNGKTPRLSLSGRLGQAAAV